MARPQQRRHERVSSTETVAVGDSGEPAGEIRTMRAFFHTCLLLSTLAAAGCAHYRVDTDFDPAFDFAAVRTWQWAQTPARAIENDPRLTNDLVHARMLVALE